MFTCKGLLSGLLGGAVALVITTAQGNILYETTARFHPQIGYHEAVATQEAVATKVGLSLLRKGGNAVDAACGIGFALAITLPRAAGLGGGGFMTLWLAKQKQGLIIDYRETAPLGLKMAMLTDAKGSRDPKKALYSYLSSGVPGTLAGLALAEKRYGRLGLAKVIQPAIDLATNGVKATPGLIHALGNGS